MNLQSLAAWLDRRHRKQGLCEPCEEQWRRGLCESFFRKGSSPFKAFELAKEISSSALANS